MTLQESGDARLRELNSADDLAELVHTIGFIPLFSNAIKGFSVEELTRGSAWWTGEPDIRTAKGFAWLLNNKR